ncbi:MAG TPA: hypothetical protein VD793_08645, partial [Gemmatimonadales bacterium]|nr:hypothetical protein [Gemmatimonadales bacterium]
MRTAARVVLAAGLCLSGAGPVAAAQTHLVLVRGLAGEEAYAARFHQWAGTLRETALRLGLPDSHITYLAEDPARDRAAISGPATRDGLAAALRRVAERSPGEATVMLVLLGHGSDRGEPRFSVPGPDLTASDLDTLLAALGTRRVAVVNATSASGGFVPALSAPGRVVVTATRSGFEQNAPTFGGYFVEAFGSPAADLDKDQRVSLLEAFQYARAQVARVYQADGRLLTEHAMLDDNGDGKGSSEP